MDVAGFMEELQSVLDDILGLSQYPFGGKAAIAISTPGLHHIVTSLQATVTRLDFYKP